MRKFVVTALAALCATGLTAAPAAAEEVQVAVEYGDLDISTAAGADTLGKRIEAAVKAACNRPDNRDLRAMQAWTDCKDQAMSDAMEQLDRGSRVATLAALTKN